MSRRGPLLSCAVAALAALWAAPARAETDEPVAAAATVTSSRSPLACRYCQPSIQHPHGRFGLHWHDHWDRVGVREGVTIGVAAATFVVLSFAGTQSEPHWSSPILMDDALREGLRADSKSGRRTAATISDALFVGSFAVPLLIDNVAVTWVARDSPEVAWQMAVINAQAYALTLSLNSLTKRLVARERPYVSPCRESSDYSSSCNGAGQFQSFYSGHAAVTATGAGLICAHHTQLELYGSPWLDGGACVLGIAVTAATGALRISSDNHWSSDVVVGHLMGYAAGYLLPTLMYYHDFRLQAEQPHSPPAVDVKVAAVPLVSDHSAQLGVMGLF